MIRFLVRSRRAAAIALIVSAALSATAFADSPDPKATLVPSASIVVHEANGRSTVIPIDQKLAEKLLADPAAKPLDTSFIVFVANNQAYMVKDHLMSDGEMMVAAILRDYEPVAGGG